MNQITSILVKKEITGKGYKMECLPVNGLKIYYQGLDRHVAELLRSASAGCLELLHESWGLTPPADCRVYLMDSWTGFVFHSAPWNWRILLALTLPLWGFYVRRLWRGAGGWTQGYGNRVVVGVKHPVALLQSGAPNPGERIFRKEVDIERKFQQIVCHELTHACTWRLKLPAWLNEGLAMLAVDRYCGEATLDLETLEILENPPPERPRRRSRRLDLEDIDSLVYAYVRSYWITRYLEATHPGLVKDLLAEAQPRQDLNAKIGAAMGIASGDLWTQINPVVVSYFQE
jgi:hypothetical protein